jgi:hypothetical protein
MAVRLAARSQRVQPCFAWCWGGICTLRDALGRRQDRRQVRVRPFGFMLVATQAALAASPRSDRQSGYPPAAALHFIRVIPRFCFNCAQSAPRRHLPLSALIAIPDGWRWRSTRAHGYLARTNTCGDIWQSNGGGSNADGRCLPEVVVLFNVLVHLPIRNHSRAIIMRILKISSLSGSNMIYTRARSRHRFETDLPRAFHPSWENGHISSLDFNRRATLRGDCHSTLQNQAGFLGRISPVTYEYQQWPYRWGKGLTKGMSMADSPKLARILLWL